MDRMDRTNRRTGVLKPPREQEKNSASEFEVLEAGVYQDKLPEFQNGGTLAITEALLAAEEYDHCETLQ